MPPSKEPALANSEYRVGWICTLPLEMTAARAMLDVLHEQPQEQHPSDHNSYCLGRIQKHNIVIGCLADYGTTSATAVALNMLSTFTEIRFCLTVGIGGGVPSSEHDIRLGDIVVSRPEGTSSGVVQYDSGKAIDVGEFERTGSLDRPPQILLKAACALESKHEMEDTEIPAFLASRGTQYPKMRISYSSPGAENDRLFREDYRHPGASKNCDACDVSQLVDREPRELDVPQIHYGLIASGN
jgi:nucleoside phosphorylase